MKKFITLFTMLSCLSVFSAQATIKINVWVPNPNVQKMFWWGAANAPQKWNDAKTISELAGSNTTVRDGDTFYQIILTPNANENTGVIFRNGDNQTADIMVQDGNEYYFYYFGHNKVVENNVVTFTAYYTECPVFFEIAGSFNGWGEHLSFERHNMTNWTLDLDLSDKTNDIEFKFKTPGMNNDQGWFGYDNIGFSYPNGWITGSTGSNFQFHHSSTGYKKYKLSVTWAPGTDFTAGWSNAVIEGDGPLYLSDNTILPSSATSVIYTRNNGSNQWGTLCLPFKIQDVTASKYNNVTFYNLGSVDETSMHFTPISEGSIAAGTPVVFKLSSSPLTIEESNVDVTSSAGYNTVSGWTLRGTFSTLEVSDKYVIWQDEIHPSGTIDVPPYRAYFEAPSGFSLGAPLRISIDDTEDIKFIEQEDGTVKAYYDLQGRKLNSRKGLVIENGKIIMIK